MRILLTGVSGLIGSNLAAALVQQSWDVLGLWCAAPADVPGADTAGVDMLDRAACVAAAIAFEPDTIVHAASAGPPGQFECDPRLAQRCVLGVEHTLAAARMVRARYVLVSCDWVFSGLRPAGALWDERERPEPVNAYGRAQAAAEETVRESGLRWLITRVADVYGVNLARPGERRPPGAGLGGADLGEARAHHIWERSGVAMRVGRRLRDGASLAAPADVRRSPTYAWDYAQRVCELIAQRREGVYHTAGPDSVHRREYLRLIARAFGADPELVRAGGIAEYLEACGEDRRLPLPPNTALDSGRASAALGHPSVDVEAGLWLMSEQLQRALAG
ncbi:MAG TPA: sugar nucleotide-binding protein [Solirubrobacteraceae bacterium]|jgi:dTDP-4-dehydrorhamnose reductase